MTSQRWAITLTIVNLGLLIFLAAQSKPVGAEDAAPILRGRALEIVDAAGRIRASITINPPITVDSRKYPESVLLRLSDPVGGPGVKLQTSQDGSGLRLGGVETSIDLAARRTGSLLRLTNADGSIHVLEP